MSTMSTFIMIGQLQQRVPMNLSRDYCMLKLNEAYQWIEQQGSFAWGVRLVTVSVAAGTYWINLTGNSNFAGFEGPDFAALTSIDIGKPIDIFQAPLGGFRVTIPFVPPDRLGLYQIFNTTPIPGVFAAWTLLSSDSAGYQIRFAPSSAATTVAVNFAMQYHRIPDVLIDLPSQFFPTPDQFNTLILDIAEAEIKRNYNIMGWETAQQKAAASTMMLADQYRSSKLHQVGMGEEVKDAQETQASAAGN